MSPLRFLHRAAATALPLVLLGGGACAGPAERAAPDAAPGAVPDEPRIGVPGGRLVTALRAEPRTFNPLAALDAPSRTVLDLLHADLVHIDRRTQRTVPALAESWEVSADGQRYLLRLRRGVLFSDGEPFDADDVIFTFDAIFDDAVGSPHRSLLTIDGELPTVRKIDSHTVELRLPGPYAVGDRLFDSIAVLPEHRLRAAWEAGRLAEAWTVDTPPATMTGLGPFRLASYLPGDRVQLERNPHYWKLDAADRRLPYLDRLVILFVGSEEAEAVRLQAGELDVSSRLSAKNFGVLARGADRSELRLVDLGASLVYNFLFFNLNDLGGRGLPAVAAKQRWFRDRLFRLAVSSAIDREALARLVYDGRATPLASHVTPGNKLWRNEALTPPIRSLSRARALLTEAGYRWSDGGRLVDPAGEPVGFSLITNATNTQRMQMATIVQEDLRQLGIEVAFVALEFRTLLERILTTFDYEACLLGLGGGDVDPNSDLSVWASDGGRHLWEISEPRSLPAWQAEIDALLRRQIGVTDRAERKRLYDRVQEIAVDQQPLILLVSPNVLVAAKARLGNFRPAVMEHSTLWNADELFWLPDELSAGS